MKTSGGRFGLGMMINQKEALRAQVLALLTAGEIDQIEAGLPGLISKKRRVLLASRV